jgi:hypothetical protein
VALDASKWHELRSRGAPFAGAHARPREAEVKWVNLNRTGRLADQLALSSWNAA